MTARLGLLIACALCPGAGKTTWDFEGIDPGKTAPGFRTFEGIWTVGRDKDGNGVLFQSARNGDDAFNLVLIEDTKLRDVDLSVRMKANTGEIDQGSGLVWRAKDARNYYVCRYNPLEDNYRVYRVKDGKRSLVKGVKVAGDNDWHILRVTMKGPKITCALDGKTLIDVEDDTFRDAGRIGLWCKADAQSAFDDLTAEGE